MPGTKFKPNKSVKYDKLVREYAGLAMIRTLPDYFLDKANHKGRVETLLTRTREAVDSILAIYPYYDDQMKEDIGAILTRFHKSANLHDKGRHILTMICFTLDMAETMKGRSPWPATGYHAQTRFIRSRGLHRAITALTELFLYYEELNSNAGKIPLCIAGGRNLAEKWEEAINA